MNTKPTYHNSGKGRILARPFWYRVPLGSVTTAQKAKIFGSTRNDETGNNELANQFSGTKLVRIFQIHARLLPGTLTGGGTNSMNWTNALNDLIKSAWMKLEINNNFAFSAPLTSFFNADFFQHSANDGDYSLGNFAKSLTGVFVLQPPLDFKGGVSFSWELLWKNSANFVTIFGADSAIEISTVAQEFVDAAGDN